MRNIFADWITELATKDDKVILIVIDIGYGTFDKFRELHSDRFFNFGICEQSTISASAGIALEGLKPYVFGITPFLTERAFEQIKVDIGLNNANVKLIGYDDYPNLGPTHSMLDEGSYMNSLKDIKSYFPKTKEEVIFSLEESYRNNEPTFIRLRKL